MACWEELQAGDLGQARHGLSAAGIRPQALYNAQDTSPGCWEESEEFHAFIVRLV